MNFVHKTLTKTFKTNIFLPSTTINGCPFSLSSIKPHFHDPQLHFLSPLQENHISTTSNELKPEKILRRPSEIPFQPKVANWVNLIGTVQMHIISFTSGDGNSSFAGTVVSQPDCPWNPNSPLSRIPIIFQGDLAHTAATHLKKNVIVYVSGHLSRNPVPIKLLDDEVKVMVHDVYFVRGYPGGPPGHPTATRNPECVPLTDRRVVIRFLHRTNLASKEKNVLGVIM